MMGSCLGPAAICGFLKEIVFAEPGISAVITDPETRNLRSLRGFEKAGFAMARTVQIRGESFQRRVVRLDRQSPSCPVQRPLRRRAYPLGKPRTEQPGQPKASDRFRQMETPRVQISRLPMIIPD
jgi:hypothetical protein